MVHQVAKTIAKDGSGAGGGSSSLFSIAWLICGWSSFAGCAVALNRWATTGGGGGEEQRALQLEMHQQVPSQYLEWPMAAFGAVLMLNLMNLTLRQNNTRLRTNLLLLFINVLAFTTDVLIHLGYTPVARGEGTGRLFHPLRYFQWAHTTPTMIYMIYISSDTSVVPVQHLLWALANDVAMMLTGLASTWMSGIPQVFWGAVSFVNFLIVVFFMYRMVLSTIKDTHDADARSTLWALLGLTLTLWHSFPAVWLLAQLQVISPATEHLAWGFCDYVAKCVFSSQLWQSNIATSQERRESAYRAWEESNRAMVVDKLNALVKAKDKMVHMMSHELRTPILGIMALATSLLKEARSPMGVVSDRHLAMIRSSATCLLNVINTTLSTASPDKQRQVHVEAVRLSPLVEEVCHLIRPLVRDQVRLTNSVASSLPYVAADRTKLQQIFFNLIGNAARFTHTGYIKVGARVMGDQVEMYVQDTGIGVPQDKMDAIFQPYDQGSADIAASYGGTGLGLYLVKLALDAHNSAIRVESKVGEGACFHFSLPLASEEMTQEAELRSTLNKGPSPTPSIGDASSGGALQKLALAAAAGASVCAGGAQNGATTNGQFGGMGLAASNAAAAAGDDPLLAALHEAGMSAGDGSSERGGGASSQGRPSLETPPGQAASSGKPRDPKRLSLEEALGLTPTTGAAAAATKVQRALGEKGSAWSSLMGTHMMGLEGSLTSQDRILLKMPNRYSSSTLQILSVDDDLINQVVAEQMIKSQKWKVVKATNGMQALEYIENAETLPDLILLDIMMPGMSGYEVCSRLRARYPSSLLPIIMVSAKGEEEDVVQALQRGADDYVTKPYKLTELTERMRAQVRTRDTLRALEEVPPEALGDLAALSQSQAASDRSAVGPLEALAYPDAFMAVVSVIGLEQRLAEGGASSGGAGPGSHGHQAARKTGQGWGPSDAGVGGGLRSSPSAQLLAGATEALLGAPASPLWRATAAGPAQGGPQGASSGLQSQQAPMSPSRFAAQAAADPVFVVRRVVAALQHACREFQAVTAVVDLSVTSLAAVIPNVVAQPGDKQPQQQDSSMGHREQLLQLFGSLQETARRFTWADGEPVQLTVCLHRGPMRLARPLPPKPAKPIWDVRPAKGTGSLCPEVVAAQQGAVGLSDASNTSSRPGAQAPLAIACSPSTCDLLQLARAGYPGCLVCTAVALEPMATFFSWQPYLKVPLPEVFHHYSPGLAAVTALGLRSSITAPVVNPALPASSQKPADGSSSGTQNRSIGNNSALITHVQNVIRSTSGFLAGSSKHASSTMPIPVQPNGPAVGAAPAYLSFTGEPRMEQLYLAEVGEYKAGSKHVQQVASHLAADMFLNTNNSHDLSVHSSHHSHTEHHASAAGGGAAGGAAGGLTVLAAHSTSGLATSSNASTATPGAGQAASPGMPGVSSFPTHPLSQEMRASGSGAGASAPPPSLAHTQRMLKLEMRLEAVQRELAASQARCKSLEDEVKAVQERLLEATAATARVGVEREMWQRMAGELRAMLESERERTSALMSELARSSMQARMGSLIKEAAAIKEEMGVTLAHMRASVGAYPVHPVSTSSSAGQGGGGIGGIEGSGDGSSSAGAGAAGGGRSSHIHSGSSLATLGLGAGLTSMPTGSSLTLNPAGTPLGSSSTGVTAAEVPLPGMATGAAAGQTGRPASALPPRSLTQGLARAGASMPIPLHLLVDSLGQEAAGAPVGGAGSATAGMPSSYYKRSSSANLPTIGTAIAETSNSMAAPAAAGSGATSAVSTMPSLRMFTALHAIAASGSVADSNASSSGAGGQGPSIMRTTDMYMHLLGASPPKNNAMPGSSGPAACSPTQLPPQHAPAAATTAQQQQQQQSLSPASSNLKSASGSWSLKGLFKGSKQKPKKTASELSTASDSKLGTIDHSNGQLQLPTSPHGTAVVARPGSSSQSPSQSQLASGSYTSGSGAAAPGPAPVAGHMPAIPSRFSMPAAVGYGPVAGGLGSASASGGLDPRSLAKVAAGSTSVGSPPDNSVSG